LHISAISSDAALLSLSPIDLVLLNNAINETLNAVTDSELQTRTGCTGAEFKAALQVLQSALDQLK
jgi:hypothetical protein